MPKKWASKEEKLQYQRDLYARNPELRARTVENVRRYKLEHYSGTCIVCGGTTKGNSPSTVPRFCNRTTECRSAARKKPVAAVKHQKQPSLMDVFRSPETWAP